MAHFVAHVNSPGEAETGEGHEVGSGCHVYALHPPRAKQGRGAWRGMGAEAHSQASDFLTSPHPNQQIS